MSLITCPLPVVTVSTTVTGNHDVMCYKLTGHNSHVEVLSDLMLQFTVNRVLSETKSQVLAKILCNGGI